MGDLLNALADLFPPKMREVRGSGIFVCYHRRDASRAASIAEELRSSGFRVAMYSPFELWHDPLFELARILEEEVSVVVYVKGPLRATRWVRAEREWTSELRIPMISARSQRGLVPRILALGSVPQPAKERYGQATLASRQMRILRTHFDTRSLKQSRAIDRTIGLFTGRFEVELDESLQPLRDEADRSARWLLAGLGVLVALAVAVAVSWLRR